MTPATLQLEKDFLTYVNKMTAYNEALGLIFWDLRTGAPKKAIEQRSQVIGTLSAELFELSTSDQMASFIAGLSAHKDKLSEVTVKTLEECQKEYDRNKKIPAEEYREYKILQSKAESVWEEAKEAGDFSLLAPYLEKLVETNRRFTHYWGYEGNPYNTLLDLFEPGMTVDILDSVFTKVQEAIVPLVKKIQTKQQPDTSFLHAHFPEEAQKKFSLEMLKRLGFDFEAGRLDEAVHPFATGLNPGDVRVTTRYNEHDFKEAIFGTIHECGHALYEQNVSEKLTGTPLSTGTSMGIHESQSLFFENFVGRNPKFWEHNYDLLKEFSSGQFDSVPIEDFVRSINESKPSLIRVDADELTYCLHIIIRYEIEKGLINGDIKVMDLPKIWNEKYEEYLGIRPENDAEGVLQDVHWSGGAFGYFPSYALGYIYAAQLKKAMLKDLPDYEELLADGNFKAVKDWMVKHVHQYGKLKKPLDIITDSTGEGLNPQYLIDYLTEKYSELYSL
ncbi:carboxypeptidase M32 [Jeotgalibacillus proteolyticus]|uniref:Metal-dependent carboxypeptidase n=1 Tax=Jeotgalibacillus proteolyticus TaxID=2082395 RepID=A0A2S5GDV4_9BACL|nr:carboxypeptidase M32 [Jeotgalibacillus proteolyticus]PPA71222.1 carboxypeptidase M32 [Jeotgalibacillus proteolyticus]